MPTYFHYGSSEWKSLPYLSFELEPKIDGDVDSFELETSEETKIVVDPNTGKMEVPYDAYSMSDTPLIITVYAIVGGERILSTTIKALRESEITDFKPGLGIHFTTKDFTLVKGKEDEIPFITYSPFPYFSCSSNPPLPSGLELSSFENKIKGTATELQDKTEYEIVCDDMKSLSNVVNITIAVSEYDVLIPGIGAYYMKMSTPDDDYCSGTYEPGNSNVNLRVQRIDAIIDFEEGDGIWEGLGSEMTVPFAVKWTGYLNITNVGTYFAKYIVADSYYFDAGADICSMGNGQCGKQESSFRCQFKAPGVYPYSYKVAFHKNDPDVKLDFCYGESVDNCESHNIAPYNEVQYRYISVVYTKSEPIPENKVIYKPDGVIKKITKERDLPAGLDITEDGTIYGTPTGEDQQSSSYKIIFEYENGKKYETTINIEIQSEKPPSEFYLYDIVEGKNVGNNVSVFIEDGLNHEILAKVGNVLSYEITSKLPDGIEITTPGSKTIIVGKPTSAIESFEVTFIAKGIGSIQSIGSIMIYFVGRCEGNKKYISINAKGSARTGRLTLEIRDSKDDLVKEWIATVNDLSNSYYDETFVCLNEENYRFVSTDVMSVITLNVLYGSEVIITEVFRPTSPLDKTISLYFGAPSFNYGNDTLIITTDNFINLLPFVKGKIDNYTLVSGDLPNGLSFNTADGSITGEFETIFETIITVYGYGPNGNGNCTFTLIGEKNREEENCELAGDLFLKVIYNITDLNKVFRESIEVKILNGDQTIYITDVKRLDLGVKIEKICVEEGPYTFKFSDSNREGWGSNTVSIQMYDTIIIPNINLVKYTIDGAIEWNYNDKYVKDWNLPSFSQQWKSSLISNLPQSTTKTMYLRKLMVLSSKSEEATFIMRLNYYSGIVVYINGKEFLRRNVRTGVLGENDEATGVEKELTVVRFILPTEMLLSTVNVISVELHKYSLETSFPQLKFFVMPLGGDENGCTAINPYGGRVVSANPPGTRYPADNAFVYEGTSYWSDNTPSDFPTNPIYAEIEFNDNNYYYFNQFVVKFGTGYAEGAPKHIELIGELENGTWISLVEENDTKITKTNKNYQTSFYDKANVFHHLKVLIHHINDDSYNAFYVQTLGFLSCPLTYCGSEVYGNTTFEKSQNGKTVNQKCKYPEDKEKSFICDKGTWRQVTNECEEPPVIISKQERCEVQLGVEINIQIVNVIGNIISYKMINAPPGLYINETTGYLMGKLSDSRMRERLLSSTEVTIIIEATGGTTETKIIIESVLAPHPVIESYNKTITLISGVKYDKLIFNKVYGENLKYYVSEESIPLPSGLYIDEDEGYLYGSVFGESRESYKFVVADKDDKEPYYMNVEIIVVVGDDPILINSLDNITFYYEVEDEKEFMEVTGKNLEFTASDTLPNGLTLDKTTGKIKGKITYTSDSQEKDYIIQINIRSTTGTKPIMVPMKIVVELPSFPVVMSKIDKIRIKMGEEVNEKLYSVIGKNLIFELSKQIPGLVFVLENEGSVSGIVYESILNQTITISIRPNSSSSANAATLINIEIIFIVNYKPTISSILHPKLSLIRNVEISTPFALIAVKGDNLIYSIEPDLPRSLKFDKKLGMISGEPSELSVITNYTITVSNDYGEDKTFIEIEIVTLYCEKDGRWPKSEIGRATMKCDGEGVIYRDCLFNSENKAEWGVEVDTCKKSSSNTGVIVGVTCGVVVVIIIIALVIIFYVRSQVVSASHRSAKEERRIQGKKKLEDEDEKDKKDDKKDVSGVRV